MFRKNKILQPGDQKCVIDSFKTSRRSRIFSHLRESSVDHAVGVSAGGVANDGHFQNVSLCLCVCFGSECGGQESVGVDGGR